MSQTVTPIDTFDGWYAKREDKACWIGDERPSGAKVRQYMAMVAAHPEGTPMVVGCSAESSQQIYVADAALRAGASAHIYVPARKQRTTATQWCIDRGANVVEVRPGYLSVVRARAKLHVDSMVDKLNPCIRWQPKLAIKDTQNECVNIPADVKRVVVPTGSGLTAIGVAIGLAELGRSNVSVVCVSVSGLTNAPHICAEAAKLTRCDLPKIYWQPSPIKYGKPCAGVLPNGDPLDMNYVAKALPFVKDGDCLWVSGMRPHSINNPI